MIRQTTLALALLIAVTGASSQTTNAPPPPPSPVAGPMTPPPIDHGAPTQIAGIINRFLINPNGDVDGLLLADQTQVNVAPHLSRTLLARLHVGDGVRISGVRIGSAPVIDAQQIMDSTGRTVVQDTPPLPPPMPSTPPALQSMQASGPIDRVIYGRRGEVAGVLLADGTSLRLPPPAVDQVHPLLIHGGEISAQGFGVATPFGRAIQVTAIGRDPASEQTVLPPPAPGALPPASG